MLWDLVEYCCTSLGCGSNGSLAKRLILKKLILLLIPSNHLIGGSTKPQDSGFELCSNPTLGKGIKVKGDAHKLQNQRRAK